MANLVNQGARKKPHPLFKKLTMFGDFINSSSEGDELLDWPNSQTCMQSCPACAAYFVGFVNKHNSLTLEQIQHSAPLTKELHVLSFRNFQKQLPLFHVGPGLWVNADCGYRH